MKKAITLIEILVVIMIIGVLSAILWVVLAPQSKERALEARIKSDLKQICTGINVYMSDHDDKYPPLLESLPASVPKRIEGFKPWKPDAIGSYDYPANYILCYNTYARRIEKYFNPVYRFDPQVNSIVETGFNWRTRRGDGQIMSEPGVLVSRKNMVITEVLGVKLDGSIQWRPTPEPFQENLAMLAHKLQKGMRE